MNLLPSIVRSHLYVRLTTRLSPHISAVCRALPVLLFTLLFALSLFAQTPSSAGKGSLGSIRGTVTTKQQNTESGVAGIPVKLAIQPPQGNPLVSGSDDAGHFQFDALQPGNYILSVEQEGFKPVLISISMSPGQAITQNIRLELQIFTDQVEVHEESQTISTESVSTPAQVVSHRELVSIPTAHEKTTEVLTVTPGVIQTLDKKISLKGSDESQSLLLVNSARTTDPVTGSLSVPIPTDAVESFSVFKTPYDSGLGNFTGGLTTIDTKTPPDQWTYKIKNPIPSILGKNGHMVGIAEATPGLSFGGPVSSGKLLFSEVFQYEMKKTTVRGLPWPYDISKKQGWNSFTTLQAILSQKQTLTFTVNAFPLRQQHYDINALIPQPASNDLDQSGASVGLSDHYVFDSGAVLTTTAQYTRFDSNAHGQGPEDMLITPEGYGGNYFNQWSRRGKEFQFFPTYNLATIHWLGRHEIKFGIDVDWRSYFGTNSSHPIQINRTDGTLAETINFAGVGSRIASDTTVAEFVQDHWVMDSHWALDFGGRLSSETGGWKAAFAPRLGVAFAPGNDSKTVIRAGAGLFYNVSPLLAHDFSVNPTRTVSYFDASSQPIGSAITYTNAYVGGVNPISGAPLPNEVNTSPRNFTWSVEGNRQIRSNILARASYIDSHTTYVFLINPFTTIPTLPSYLGLTNTGSARYREIETSVRYTFLEKYQVNGSYIWSRSRGDLNNLSSVLIPFEQPVIRRNAYGILPYDVPNRFLTWAIVPIIWKVTFSPLLDVHSGYPYSNIDTLQNYVGTPNGQRFATYLSLDLKVYKIFRVPYLTSRSGNGHHLRLGAYTRNVTNHGNFNAVYNNVTSPNFGQFAGFLDRTEGAVIDFVD